MYTVTKEWLNKHRANGGWSLEQSEALGMGNPPILGWHDYVIGTQITADKKLRFEAATKVEP